MFALLPVIVSLLHYTLLPPDFAKSRVHVSRNYESFISLAKLLEESDGVEEIRLEPAGIVNVTESPNGLKISWDDDDLDRIAGLLRDTSAFFVRRQPDGISFYGGDARKLGRYFEARVLYGSSWSAVIENSKAASCLRTPIAFSSKGECLDRIGDELVLYHYWVTD